MTGPEKELRIELGGGYTVCIGEGILEGPKLHDICRPLGRSAVILTDDTVGPLYGEAIARNLSDQGLEAPVISMGQGEAAKSRKTKSIIEDQLIERGFGRELVIIAVGGGVVLDLAGFIAATFMRGVPVVYVPTTLLAMVDACIGGKTGVNTRLGKNLIGAISHPKAVVADVATLKTLPREELLGGMVEAVKHALLRSAEYFGMLVNIDLGSLAETPSTIIDLVDQSCRIKRAIVEADEMESGLRELLNLGHTVGHAIERESNYQIAHGPAVALGIIAECRISVALGLLPAEDFERIGRLLGGYLDALAPDLSSLSTGGVLEAMQRDKKIRGGKIRIVLLDRIGMAAGESARPAPEALLREAVARTIKTL